MKVRDDPLLWWTAQMSSGRSLYPSAPLRRGMSIHKVELITFTKALELVAIKKINTHMNDRYAFATAHMYWLVLCQLDTVGVLTEKGASVEEMPP